MEKLKACIWDLDGTLFDSYQSIVSSLVDVAAACGVPVLATAHAGGAAELCARQGIRLLLADGIVSRVIFLHHRRIALTASASDVLEGACLCR